MDIVVSALFGGLLLYVAYGEWDYGVYRPDGPALVLDSEPEGMALGVG